MWLGMCDVEEERVFTISSDKINASFCDLGSQQGLISQGVDHRFVLIEWQGPEVKNWSLFGMEGPHVIRVRDSEIFLEALLVRHEIRMIPQMPFPKGPGCITVGPQHFGQSDFIGMDPCFGSSLASRCGKQTSQRGGEALTSHRAHSQCLSAQLPPLL